MLQKVRLTQILILIMLSIFSVPSSSMGESNQDYHDSLSAGIARLNQNDLGVALKRFKDALSLDPKGVEAHYYLGVTHARANRDEEAEKYLLKALSLDRTFMPARFDLGILYFQVREDQKALKAFSIVEKIDPERARVHYYQGLIWRRNGNLQVSEAKLKKAAQLDPQLAAPIHFQAGISFFQEGATDSAKTKFQRVLDLSPQGDLAESAREFIKKIEQHSDVNKRWHLSASFGVQYDDNVVLDPGGTFLSTSGMTKKEDTLGIVYIKTDVQWLKHDNWKGNLEYRFYQNLHSQNSLNDFNIQDHHLVLSGRHPMGQNELNLVYEFQYVTLGGDGYLMGQQLGPKLLLKHSVDNFTELAYVFGEKDFENIQALFPSNSDRDVDTHQVGLTHIVLLRGKGNAYAGYHYKIEEAGSSISEDDWSYDSHGFKLGLQHPFLENLTGSLELEMLLRDYDHLNSQSTASTNREDDDFLLIAVLSRNLTEQMTISSQYLFQKNSSNIPIYDYDRNIFGIMITAAY